MWSGTNPPNNTSSWWSFLWKWDSECVFSVSDRKLRTRIWRFSSAESKISVFFFPRMLPYITFIAMENLSTWLLGSVHVVVLFSLFFFFFPVKYQKMLQISIRKWKWIVASSLNGNNGFLYIPCSKSQPAMAPSMYSKQTNILELSGLQSFIHLDSFNS